MVILNQEADNEDLCTPLKESLDKACIWEEYYAAVDGWLGGNIRSREIQGYCEPKWNFYAN